MLQNSCFSRKHRLFRAGWNLAWLLLAAWTPPPLHAWRRFLLRSFGAKIGDGARIYGSARIWYPPNLTMGKGACLGWKSFVYSQAPITIGDYAVISQFAHLVAGSHDIRDPDFALITAPITIGEFAWVAARAFVGPGVRIGEGAVLGGAGVTFRDLQPWTVNVGNPATVVGTRRLDHSRAQVADLVS